MAVFWGLLKKILFLVDAETVHDWTHAVLKRLGRSSWGKKTLVHASNAPAAASEPPRVFGQPFRSRLGLAAGFDKNAELLGALPHLGFGFAEIGTVTPRPQSGNERPRLFRDPANENLFNRMGFNGLGAPVAAANLREARLEGSLPLNFRVGVNVGKNKDTDAGRAHLDYAEAASHFEGLADYLVINVSSPNTPGLRDLQAVEPIRAIVDAVGTKIGGWKSVPPVLLKLAPEVEGDIFEKILTEGPRMGIAGWVLTNTWGGEWKFSGGRPSLPGGWSGKILSAPSLSRLKAARVITQLPIISVGGILSAEDAKERISYGANLVQIYSGWVYRGPRFPGIVARALHPVR